MSSEALADSLFSWVDKVGNTQTLNVDVVMSLTDKRTVKLTDHTVEDGSVITDHAIIMPESISFELVVSQTPIGGPGMKRGSVDVSFEGRALGAESYPLDVRKSQFQPGGFLLLSSGLRDIKSSLIGRDQPVTKYNGSTLDKTSGSVKAIVAVATTPSDLVNGAHDRLVEILQNLQRVTISFKGRLYIDYLLTEVELTHAAGQVGMGRFKCSARTINTVTGTSVKLPDPADFRATPQKNKGNKASTTPDPDPAKLASVAPSRAAAGVDSLSADNEGAGDFFNKLVGFGR